jgi:hypothetical protein
MTKKKKLDELRAKKAEQATAKKELTTEELDGVAGGGVLGAAVRLLSAVTTASDVLSAGMKLSGDSSSSGTTANMSDINAA